MEHTARRDADVKVARQATAGDAVTIGNGDAGTRAWHELEANAVGNITADEIMSGPQIEQGDKLLVADGDIKLHGVLRANSGDGHEGDHGRLRVEGG
jgi:hypothetical protein